MGEMAEYFEIYAQIKKANREQLKAKYEPIIKEIGGIWKSNGVYMFGNWLLYPTKGMAMNRFNKCKVSLEKVIGEIYGKKKDNSKELL